MKSSIFNFYVFVPAIQQFIAWPIANLIFKVFAGLKIEGRKNIKKLPKGIIIAANHAHEMDPILMRAMLPWLGKHSPMYYVARKRDHYTWKGWRARLYDDNFFKSWGAYPAYKGTKNYGESLKHFVNLLQKKHTVTIFPTGACKIPADEINEVKGGLGYLAHKTGLPVVPVYVEGTLNTTWSNLFKFKQKLNIRIGEPQYFLKSNPTPDIEQCKETSRKIWDEIVKLK